MALTYRSPDEIELTLELPAKGNIKQISTRLSESDFEPYSRRTENSNAKKSNCALTKAGNSMAGFGAPKTCEGLAIMRGCDESLERGRLHLTPLSNDWSLTRSKIDDRNPHGPHPSLIRSRGLPWEGRRAGEAAVRLCQPLNRFWKPSGSGRSSWST